MSDPQIDERAEREARAARLRRARQKSGLRGPVTAARKFGWNENTYKAHEQGRNGFGVADARRYARAFGVRLEWLLSLGDGEPAPELQRVPVDPGDTTEDGNEFNGLANGEPYRPTVAGARPEIDANPGAGEGSVGLPEFVAIGDDTVIGHRVIGEWLMPPAFVRNELKASPAAIIVMEVKGDSMRPTLQPGDRVLVDTQQSRFGPDAIYIVDDGDGEPRVKRLQKVSASTPPQVYIVSDNPSSKQEAADLDRIRVIGRVVGRVSRL